MDKRFDRVEDGLHDEKKKLDQVYESRDKMTLKFGWAWTMASFVIAATAAGIVGVFA